MGMLAAPALIGSALAPFLGEILLQRLGPDGALLLITAAALIPILCTAVLLALVAQRRGTLP